MKLLLLARVAATKPAISIMRCLCATYVCDIADTSQQTQHTLSEVTPWYGVLLENQSRCVTAHAAE